MAAPGTWLAAIVAIAGLGAVAHAAVPAGGRAGAAPQQASAQLPRPSITAHPRKLATSPKAKFLFAGHRPGLSFQCRLDRGRWRRCQAPAVFAQLAPGRHSFSVRTVDGRGRRSRPARFGWRLLEPRDFSVAPRLDGLSKLYPGAAPVSLPLTIENPNPVPIRVTDLRVAVSADPAGCPSAVNFVLNPAGVSASAPLRVPAGGTAALPAPGAAAPSIALRDLPVNQDACQGARLPLSFSGKARG